MGSDPVTVHVQGLVYAFLALVLFVFAPGAQTHAVAQGTSQGTAARQPVEANQDASTQTSSPDPSAPQVRAVIQTLFDGMRAGDSAAVREVFHADARLMTATDEGVQATAIDRFVAAVGNPRDDVWDERTYDVRVDVDGPMAVAWVPYAFYRGDAFSHCGVNSVQFVRTEASWQVLQLVDTRRQACDLPESVTGATSSDG